MKSLAYVVLAVLALACVLREACRRAVRAVLRALTRAREAVDAFANPSPVVADVEREPTVSERLQRLLTADDAQRERECELWAQLHAKMADHENERAELDAIIAKQSAEQAEQERITAIAAAINACLAWRTYTGGLGIVATYTPAAGGN